MTKVLITGGSGFLGRRLGRRLRGLGHEITLAARNNKQNFLATEFSACPAMAMDVARIESVRDVFSEVRPDIVIHAAATKFVDHSERFPMEALDVNVVGSQNVARVAIDCGVQTVIGISTDKAAPPVRNTYGLAKALMERLFCSMNGKSDTRFLCVRYGNVAWSTASVLSAWRRDVKRRSCIRTTGPEMLRFFFTVDEAVDLVVTALDRSSALQGKVLSREMKSARIGDILDVWVERDKISYERVAGRPGERHDEVLIGETELPFTSQQVIGGIKHFVLSFNERADPPLEGVPSAGAAERLTRTEMLNLLDNPPEEELTGA